MKIFGKELFKKSVETELYDFAQHGLLERSQSAMISDLELRSVAMEYAIDNMPKKSKKKTTPAKEVKPLPEITPKELFELKSLNDNEFKIAADVEYIDVHVADMKDRLKLFKEEKNTGNGNNGIWMVGGLSGAELYGKKEIESMIERLNNRLHLSEYKNILEEYPHTSSLRISKVLEEHKHLRCNTAGQFVPDLPKEATQSMKRYNEMCQKLCGKNTNFYIIAKKTDFEKVPAKRDPILLAQSPFGFFWQILGAWDEEMQYLGDL